MYKCSIVSCNYANKMYKIIAKMFASVGIFDVGINDENLATDA